MPDYRTGDVKGVSRLGTLSKFLNIKKSFDDAVRQERWKREHEATQQHGARVSSAASMASSGGYSGDELNSFVDTGKFPPGQEPMTSGPQTYIQDPITGELKGTGGVGRRDRVIKGVLSPDQMKERGKAQGEADFYKENMKQSGKLGTAVKRLALLNKQFKEALPSGDRTPLEQRIGGQASTWAAKAGLVNNPKLVALQRNIRPMAITMIRAFGEVGNLSESEQQGAIDTVNQANLTDKERIAATKQFIEFALAGANDDGIAMLRKQKDLQGIFDAFEVDLPDSGGGGDEFSNMSDEELRAIANGQ